MAPFPYDSLSSLLDRLYKNKGTLPLSEAGSLIWSLLKLLGFFRVLLLKPFNAPFGINDLLRPSKKWMTVRTNIDIDIATRRPGLIFVAACTMHRDLPIHGMNTLLHNSHSQNVMIISLRPFEGPSLYLSQRPDTSLISPIH